MDWNLRRDREIQENLLKLQRTTKELKQLVKQDKPEVQRPCTPFYLESKYRYNFWVPYKPPLSSDRVSLYSYKSTLTKSPCKNYKNEQGFHWLSNIPTHTNHSLRTRTSSNQPPKNVTKQTIPDPSTIKTRAAHKKMGSTTSVFQKTWIWIYLRIEFGGIVCQFKQVDANGGNWYWGKQKILGLGPLKKFIRKSILYRLQMKAQQSQRRVWLSTLEVGRLRQQDRMERRLWWTQGI